MAKYWKQPISTEILYIDWMTALDRAVWCEILLRAQRETSPVIFMHGDRRIEVELKKGQLIFPVNSIANELGIQNGYRRVRKSIEKLSKWYNEMTIEGRAYGLLLTVKNYDEILKMQNETTNEGRTKVERTTNESKSPYKNVENVKNVEMAASKFSKPQRVCQILGISMDKLDIIEDIVLDYRDRDFIGVAQKVKLQGKIDGKPDDQKIFTFTGWLSREHRKKEDKEEKKDPYSNYRQV